MGLRYLGNINKPGYNPLASNITTGVNVVQYQGIFTTQQQLQAITTGQWVTDPVFDYSTLLLQADGIANGSQNNTFLDSSTNNFTITRNGNTTQGTFTPFSLQPGAWSNYFNGSSSLQFPNNAALAPGTGDFTIEFWYYRISDGPIFVTSTSGGLFVGGLPGNEFGLRAFAVANICSTTNLPVANQWTHIAITRSGTTCRLFYNGVLQQTSTSSQNFVQGNSYLGTDAAGAFSTQYISNFRLVKGTAVYTAAFTPPTSPLTAITNTSLLTCQDNRFIDNSSNAFAITVNSTPSVQAFSPFAPQFQYTTTGTGGSGYFDGTGDFLSSSGSINWSTHTNITINLWVYPTNLTGSAATLQALVGTSHAQNDGYTVVYIYNDGKFAVGINGTNEIASAAGVVKANTWSYLSVVKSGSTTTLYVNGTSVATNTTGVWSNNSATVYVGNTNTQLYTGYMSGLSIVLGTATAPSGVPTSPPTNITNTNTLLNFTNAGIRDATMKNDLETVGNASVSTSVVKYGSGSMYFDGTGDSLSAPNSVNYQFGSGDFTIEAWVNFSSVSGEKGIVSYFAAGTPNAGFTLRLSTGNSPSGLRFVASGASDVVLQAAWTPSTNTWYHVAVVRLNNTLIAYINGVSIGSTSITITIGAPSAVLAVGTAQTVASSDMNGYIDDLRITKGIARYTQNFTPPSVALPRQ